MQVVCGPLELNRGLSNILEKFVSINENFENFQWSLYCIMLIGNNGDKKGEKEEGFWKFPVVMTQRGKKGEGF